MLSENFDNKKCAPKLVFFNEKKLRKIQMIFDIENWLWKSNFGTFWHLPHYTNSQNSIIFFWYVDFYPLLKNSTTRITILDMIQFANKSDLDFKELNADCYFLSAKDPGFCFLEIFCMNGLQNAASSSCTIWWKPLWIRILHTYHFILG